MATSPRLDDSNVIEQPPGPDFETAVDVDVRFPCLGHSRALSPDISVQSIETVGLWFRFLKSCQRLADIFHIWLSLSK